MNRIYRLVWNASLNLWVAVAENAKGCGKGGSVRSGVLFGSTPVDDAAPGFTLRTACRAALVLIASAAVMTNQAHAANAADASVTAGAAAISTVGNTTTIHQTTQRAAIDWTSLSTAAQEALIFNQPNAQAIALNRITGSNPSELLGSLTANGQVFILNPNGVLFGAGSQVNVGGLVASTLSMSNADFMAGNHVFSNNGAGGTSGSVVNQGTLTAAPGGYLALLAPEVRNEGVMIASLGTALLAAGNKVTLNLDNGSLLGYSIDQGAINALAENKQLIQANGGQVLLSAKAMDSLTTATVNNSGIIEAKTIANKAGRIMLMGDMETGTVNVGGTLDASAPDGGNGGFIETSAAHVNVAAGTRVTTKATDGQSGTWLIDPVDFTIAAGNAAQTPSGMGAGTLSAALDLGNVSIATDGSTAGNGDINVDSAVSWSANPGTLTLTAHRDINFNANVTYSGTGAAGLTAQAARNIALGAGVAVASTGTGSLSVVLGGPAAGSAAGGVVSLASGSSVASNGGDIAFRGNSIVLSGANVAANGGNIAMAAAGTSDTHSLEIVNSGGTQSTVSTTGTGTITLSGNLTGGGAIAVADVNAGYAGGVVLTNSSVSGGTGAITIKGNATASNGGQAERGFYLGPGGRVSGAGDITVTGTVSGSQAIAPTGKPSSMGGEMHNGGSVTSTGGNVTLSGTMTNQAHLDGAGLSIEGWVESGAAGKITLTGSATSGAGLSTGGPSLIIAGTGGLDITGTVGASSPATDLTGVRLAGAARSTGNIAVTGNALSSSATNVRALSLEAGRLDATGMAAISLTGSGVPLAATSASYDVNVAGTMVSTQGGQITLAGDRMNIGSSVNSFSGKTVVTSATAGRGIALGGAAGNDANALTLTNAELANITAGGLQVGGGAYSGNITVGGSGSPTTVNRVLSLLTTGNITQGSGALAVDKLNAVGASVTLTHADNWIDEVSGRSTAGSFAVTSSKASPLTVGTVDGVVGINSGANATTITNVNGGIAQTQAIVAASLSATARGNIDLGAANQVGSYNLRTNGTTGDISLATAGALNTSNVTISTDAGSAQTVSLSSGLDLTVGGAFGNSQDHLKLTSTGGNVAINGAVTADRLTLGTAGTTTQTQAITANGLELLGTGTHTLNHASNNVSLLAGNTGNVDYSQAGALYIANVNTLGLTASGKVLVRTTGATSDINIASTVTSGSAASDSLVLAAGRNFIIDAGATPLNPGAGRYLLYSTDPAANTFYNFFSPGNAFGRTYAANAPTDASMTSILGNRMVYSITPIITITGDNKFKVYGWADPTQTYVVGSGLVGGDTMASVLSGALGGPTGAAASAGTHAITQGTLAAGLGYSIAYTNGTLTVDKATLTASGTTANNKTYDGNATVVLSNVGSLAGLAYGEDLTLNTSAHFLDVNAGNRTVAITYALADGATGLASNYQLSSSSGVSSATIDKAVVTVSGVAADNKIYNGNANASLSNTGTLQGMVAGESLTLALFGATFADANAGIGKTVTATYGLGNGVGGVASNYQLAAPVTTTANIDKATLTVTGIVADNKTYDGNATATLSNGGYLNGLLSGEQLQYYPTGASFDNKDAGTGKTVTATYTLSDGVGGLAANYQLAATPVTATANIDARAITVTATTANKVYDGTTSSTTTLASAGVLAGDTVNFSGAALFAGKDAGIGKTVNVTGIGASGSDSGNYSFNATATTTADIGKATVTVTGLAADNKTYNGNATANLSSIGTVTGTVLGEALTLTSTGATFSDANAATGKTVTATYSLGDGAGGLAGNYQLAAAPVTTTATITQASLTVSTSDVTKTYDGTLGAAGTATVTAGTVVTGDSLSGGTFAFTDKNAGSGNKTVTTSGVTVNDGNGGNNYSVTYVDNTSSTINKANLSLSTSDVSKTYDGTRNAAGSLLVTAGTVFTGDTATGGSFAFTDKNAGTGNKTVTTTGATVNDGNGGNNYNVTYVDNTNSTINKANLSLSTADVSKSYDGTNSAAGSLSVAAGTVFTGDTATGGSFAFTDKNAGTGNKTVTTAGVTVNDGNGGNNYNVTYVDNTTSTISKANLTVTANAVNKTYDGTLGATGTGSVGTLAGAGAGESVNTAATQTFTDKNYGIGNKTVQASGLTIKDSGNVDVTGNYNIAYVDNTSSTINKANVTVSTSDVTKTYDGTTAAVGTATVTAGTVFTGDSLSGGSFAFTNKNAGTGNKTVTAAGVTVNDGNGGNNYDVTYMDNTTSTINKAGLTVTASGVSKVYDGSTTATVGLGDNRVTGDMLGITASASFADKNAGNAKAVGVSGIAVSGADAGNYNLLNSTAATTADITPKALTVTANNDAQTGGIPYSGGNGVTYNGLVAGETAATVLTGGLAYGGSSQGAYLPGDYDITVGGLLPNGNYSLGFVPGRLTLSGGVAATAALGGNTLVGAYQTSLNNVGGSGLLSGVSVEDGKGKGGGDAAAAALNAAAAEAGQSGGE